MANGSSSSSSSNEQTPSSQRPEWKQPARPVFTALMSLPEAMQALGVLKLEHMRTLAQKHFLRHYPFRPEQGPSMFEAKGIGWVLRGDFVESIARCSDCRIGLLAARTPDTEVSVSVDISPYVGGSWDDGLEDDDDDDAPDAGQQTAQEEAERAAQPETPDEKLDHSREYRIGG